MALNVSVNNKNCAFRVRGKIKQMIFSSRSLLEKRLYVPPLFGASGERVSTIKLLVNTYFHPPN